MKSSDDLINNKNMTTYLWRNLGEEKARTGFRPSWGKTSGNLRFSLRHLDTYHKVREEKSTQPTQPRIEIRNLSIFSNKKRSKNRNNIQKTAPYSLPARTKQLKFSC
jgi:hypothetical protein